MSMFGAEWGSQLANGKQQQSPQETHFSRLSIARSAAACQEEVHAMLCMPCRQL